MRGLYLEEFEVGRVYRHPFTRTVSEYDNIAFTSLTMNVAPLHLDEEFARSVGHPGRVVNSNFVLALVGAFHVMELTFRTSVGNRGWSAVTHPHQVYAGDTLRGETTVIAVEPEDERSGLVTFEHRGYNQRDEPVCIATRVGIMLRQPAAD